MDVMMGEDELSKGNVDSRKLSCQFTVASLRHKAHWEVTFEQTFGIGGRRRCEEKEKEPFRGVGWGGGSSQCHGYCMSAEH